MAILKRVRHVLGTEPDGTSRAGRCAAGVMALAVLPALWVAASAFAPPAAGQEERDEVRERERSDSPEARERERDRDPAAEPREGDPGRRDRDAGEVGAEFEQAIRDVQRQAREAQARAEQARRRAEEFVRHAEEMMRQRERRMRSPDGISLA